MRRFRFGIVPLSIGDRNPRADAVADHYLDNTVIGNSRWHIQGRVRIPAWKVLTGPGARNASAIRRTYSSAALSMEAKLRSTSSLVVAQEDTLMRMAVWPCHTVEPHQQVPSACRRAMVARVFSAEPNETKT